jgi:hypothetical protein
MLTLDFGLDVFDGIGGLDLEKEANGLASEKTVIIYQNRRGNEVEDGGIKKASSIRSSTL